MVKFHILAANASSRIEIPEGKKSNIVANESIPCPKDKNPRKWKLQQIDNGTP